MVSGQLSLQDLGVLGPAGGVADVAGQARLQDLGVPGPAGGVADVAGQARLQDLGVLGVAGGVVGFAGQAGDIVGAEGGDGGDGGDDEQCGNGLAKHDVLPGLVVVYAATYLWSNGSLAPRGFREILEKTGN